MSSWPVLVPCRLHTGPFPATGPSGARCAGMWPAALGAGVEDDGAIVFLPPSAVAHDPAVLGPFDGGGSGGSFDALDRGAAEAPEINPEIDLGLDPHTIVARALWPDDEQTGVRTPVHARRARAHARRGRHLRGAAARVRPIAAALVLRV